MKNENILENLKNHLSTISVEDFQREWDEIELMGFDSDINIEDFLKTLDFNRNGEKPVLNINI